MGPGDFSGATEAGAASEAERPVSIHAPRAGRDRRIGRNIDRNAVSIHAPRAGRDVSCSPMMSGSASFNPRAHRSRPRVMLGHAPAFRRFRDAERGAASSPPDDLQASRVDRSEPRTCFPRYSKNAAVAITAFYGRILNSNPQPSHHLQGITPALSPNPRTSPFCQSQALLFL